MIEAAPLALAIDALTGEPPALWRRIGHPVTWFGRAIDAADKAFNQGENRERKGLAAIVAVVALFALPAAFLSGVLWQVFGPVALLLDAALASALIAHRSLHEHVAAVANAPSLEEGRSAVAMIVGRDTSALDEAGVARASLETLSESLSDGVVAPTFWFAFLGLPGIVAYKVVNTADSMIGHRTPRHEAFGAASARIDDAMNIVPARLTAALTLLAAPHSLSAAKAVARDAARHVSPNAGWPEAAFAHSLGIALGGPRRYGTRQVEGVWLNAGGSDAQRADIEAGLALSRRIGILHCGLYVLLAAAILMI